MIICLDTNCVPVVVTRKEIINHGEETTMDLGPQ